MSCCSESGLLPLDQALARMLKTQPAVRETETLPLPLALDRVLAKEFYSAFDVPGTDNSAMDGYAVRAEDCPGNLRVIGDALAGHPFRGPLNSGEAVRITTGAPVPAGADSVVMQEVVTLHGDRLLIEKAPPIGSHIRRAGEDTRKGQLLLGKGQVLNPFHIGLLASAGVHEVEVFRRLKVALLSTGDELISHPDSYTPGKIFDSNRPMLAALLQRLPVELLDLGIIEDQPETLREAFRRAMEGADVIISTGGVSVGEADFTKDILAELGNIDFWKVAVKPGKPFAFGRLDRSLFFGLPGNPVSSAVTYHQLVVPVLRKLAGENAPPAVTIKAVTAQALKKSSGRLDFQRGVLQTNGGENTVTTSGSQGSGQLRSLVNANCFIRLEQERGPVSGGETVDVILPDRFIQ